MPSKVHFISLSSIYNIIYLVPSKVLYLNVNFENAIFYMM